MKKIAQQITELNKKNNDLFSEKADLEERILEIDIELFEMNRDLRVIINKLMRKLI